MLDKIITLFLSGLMLTLTLVTLDLALNTNKAKIGIKNHLTGNTVKAYRSIK